MRKLSSEFRRQQNNGVAKYLKYIDITLKDGQTLHLTNENLWDDGFKLEDAVSSDTDFSIGSAITNQCTININNIEGGFSEYVFEGAKVICYVGVRINDSTIEKIRMCSMTVVDAPYQECSIIELTCQDDMRKFDRDYSDSKLQYPTTRAEIIRDACEVCEVQFLESSWENDTYIVEKRPDDEGLTFHQVLAWVAQIGCQWLRCDEFGRLCIGWYDTDPDEERVTKITQTCGVTMNLEDVVITGVKVTEYTEDSQEKAQTYQYGDEGYVMYISGNKLISEGKGEKIAEIIGKRCIGMRFRPFQANRFCDVAHEAGDAVLVPDKEGATHKSYLTRVVTQPGANQEVECNARSATRNSSQNYSGATKAQIEARKIAQKQLRRYDKQVQQMTQLISQGFGMYMTGVKQEDGSTIYYMHDKPQLEESSYTCYWSTNGIIASLDGGTTWAIDRNGNALYNVITARGINANWINTGELKVTDEAGNEAFYVNCDTGEVRIKAITALNGLRVVTLSLTNEYVALPASSTGVVSDYSNAVTQISVFLGSKDVTEESTYTITAGTGTSGTWDAETKTYKITGLTKDTGYVDIKATYNFEGEEFTATKRFMVVKLKQGNDATPYVIDAPDSVTWNQTDELYEPSNPTLVVKNNQSGTQIASFYDWKIEVTTDWVNWVTRQTSKRANTITLNTKVYTLSNNVVAARVTLYQLNTTIIVARKTIQFLVQLKTQREIFNALTNNGAAQGLYINNGKLYVNAEYMVTGILTDKSGKSYWNLNTGEMQISGKLKHYAYDGTKSIEIVNNQMRIYDWTNDGNYVGSIGATKRENSDKVGIDVWCDAGEKLTLGYHKDETDRENVYVRAVIQIDADTAETSTPWIKNTKGGTIFKNNPNGGIKVENGLIKDWSIYGMSGTVKVGDAYLEFKDGLLVGGRSA